jgi:hypothetical protein
MTCSARWFRQSIQNSRSWVSLAVTATGSMDRVQFQSGPIFYFPLQRPDRTWSTHNLPSNGYRMLYVEFKRAGSVSPVPCRFTLRDASLSKRRDNFPFAYTRNFTRKIRINTFWTIYVTNGSKTSLMDVIGFLCLSLGSSTVQFHESLGSRRACACSEAGFGGQNGDRAWGVYYQRAVLCVQKQNLNAKEIHNEAFPVYCRKCLSREAFHNCVANVSQMKKLKRRCGSGWENSQNTSILRISTHWQGDGKMYQCLWRICREINIFRRL